MKRVRFSEFVTVRVLSESAACRKARRSDWALVARNRQSFCRRIALCAKLIGYCLDPVHRIKIKRLFSL